MRHVREKNPISHCQYQWQIKLWLSVFLSLGKVNVCSSTAIKCSSIKRFDNDMQCTRSLSSQYVFSSFCCLPPRPMPIPRKKTYLLLALQILMQSHLQKVFCPTGETRLNGSIHQYYWCVEIESRNEQIKKKTKLSFSLPHKWITFFWIDRSVSSKCFLEIGYQLYKIGLFVSVSVLSKWIYHKMPISIISLMRLIKCSAEMDSHCAHWRPSHWNKVCDQSNCVAHCITHALETNEKQKNVYWKSISV